MRNLGGSEAVKMEDIEVAGYMNDKLQCRNALFVIFHTFHGNAGEKLGGGENWEVTPSNTATPLQALRD